MWLINLLLKAVKAEDSVKGRTISNIQRDESSCVTSINHEDFGQADELWCRLSMHAGAGSLTTTFTQDRTDTGANQQQ